MEIELSVAAALIADQRLATIFDGTSVPGYKFFDGLIREVTRVIMGDPSDLENFPGVAAAGVRVFVKVPTTINQNFQLSIDSDLGVSEESLVPDVKNAILNYVNALPIGGDIIISELIFSIQSIPGVFDVRFTIPSENVVVGEDEIARTKLANMVVL